jgi:two-component system CheB/CheR fusion protein
VDHQLRILRFTPAATRIINLILSDVGRPVGHIVSNLMGYDRMVADVQAVLDTLIPKELEVQTTAGMWYTMRILPYRTMDNVIEGVVITFTDITEGKKTQEALRETEKLFKSLFENTLNAVAIHEIVLDAQGNPVDYIFLQANPAYERHTGLRVEDVLGKRVTQVYPGTEKMDIIEIYGKVALSGEPASFERFFEMNQRHYSINAYQVGKGRFAVVFEDITDRKRKNRTAQRAEAVPPGNNGSAQ